MAVGYLNLRLPIDVFDTEISRRSHASDGLIAYRDAYRITDKSCGGFFQPKIKGPSISQVLIEKSPKLQFLVPVGQIYLLPDTSLTHLPHFHFHLHFATSSFQSKAARSEKSEADPSEPTPEGYQSRT
jgi:hypothetical protein